MVIRSDYQEQNRVESIEDVPIPPVQFPENTEQDTIQGAGQQQLTAPPDSPLPVMPRVDIPLQDTEFDTYVTPWQSAPELKATMPGGSSANIAVPFIQDIPPPKDLTQPINEMPMEHIANLSLKGLLICLVCVKVMRSIIKEIMGS